MSIIAFKMVLQLNSVILVKELKKGVEPNSNIDFFWQLPSSDTGKFVSQAFILELINIWFNKKMRHCWIHFWIISHLVSQKPTR